MIYRREIDGLRAIAVVPAGPFHAGFKLFGGGYIGVDIFFVISGYLITGLLLAELEAGEFSLVRFYERRARRILPALFLVLACSIPFAWLWMTPDALRRFSLGLGAIALFVSNILFWREHGYFAPDGALDPLLHTWSLAVEEQFYLLFPLILMTAWRLGPKRVFWLIAGAAVLSLLASEWGWRHKPAANFYLAPTRAWELLAGSLCAWWLARRAVPASNGASVAGIVLIIASILTFDVASPVPGLAGLVPVLGTVLVILFCSGETWTARWLGSRGLVGIGLISYSAYLWHQPLFAFARLRSITEPSQPLLLALAGLTFVLAALSWRFVERPFRKPGYWPLTRPRSVLVVGTLGGLMLAGLGVIGFAAGGFPGRFSPQEQALALAARDKPDTTCHFSEAKLPASLPLKDCLEIRPGAPMVLLLGDSHSWASSRVMRSLLGAEGIGSYDFSYSGCLPLTGLNFPDGRPSAACAALDAAALRDARRLDARTIVLSARYQMYLHGAHFDNGLGGADTGDCARLDLGVLSECEPRTERQRQVMLAALEGRIRALAGTFALVLVDPVPEAGWNVPERSFKLAYFRRQTGAITTPLSRYEQRTREISVLFERLAAQLPNVRRARVARVLCDVQRAQCVNADAGGVYYFDDNHLSETGVRLVAPTIIEQIRAALGDPR